MPVDIQIQRAIFSHLPAIVNIYNQAVRSKFETASRKEHSAADKGSWFHEHNERHPIYVALEDGQIVGWYALSAYRKGREALSGVREVSY